MLRIRRIFPPKQSDWVSDTGITSRSLLPVKFLAETIFKHWRNKRQYYRAAGEQEREDFEIGGEKEKAVRSERAIGGQPGCFPFHSLFCLRKPQFNPRKKKEREGDFESSAEIISPLYVVANLTFASLIRWASKFLSPQLILKAPDIEWGFS